MAYEHCDSFLSFIKRDSFPEFDRFLALEHLVDKRAKGCPLCSNKVRLKSKNDCVGHGEYYESMYIYCDHCRLSYLFFLPPGSINDDFLSVSELWINDWNRRTGNV